MKRILAVLALASAFAACRSESSETHEASPPTQHERTPFDGKSLSSWDGDPRFWRAEGGSIVGESTAANPCKETTYLVWRGGEVRDFELHCRFKIQGGNSGVQFRSRVLDGWKVAGPQADIEDGPNWTGCLYDQDGLGVVARRGQLVILGEAAPQTIEVGDGAALLAKFRANDWNDYTIRVRGPEIELVLNGERMCQVIDRRAAAPKSGLLALQLHQGAPMRVEFRDLRLVDLESSTAEHGATEGHPAALSFAGDPPQWIWTSKDSPDGQVATFTRRVELRHAPRKAVLRAEADNQVRAFVNGEFVFEHRAWWDPIEKDVTALLHEGENEIALAGRNDGGPAALWIELVVDGEHGRELRLVSDASWNAAPIAAKSSYEGWKPADFDRARASPPYVVGPYGTAPWGSLAGAASSPAQVPDEPALAASELTLPDGFRAELLYSVPKSKQGSWVVMCEDDRGRLFTCDQYGGLYRVTPAPIGADPSQTKVESVPIELGDAQGLCWAFDSLYVVVSDGPHEHGLYRVRDTNGDGELDSAVLLRKFDGSGEHGPHAVVLGPDQKLWIVAGNHTKPPEPIDSYRLPPTWSEDHLLPVIEDPNGHAVGIRAPGGWIVRTDADGKSWELWAAGFRNAYDIAFDAQGELYTFDSDMEWDIGAPWYRPTRVCHVVSGAEFGWRSGSANWPPWYVDSAPGTCDLGLSSPTGVAFGTNARFPEHYREALFACDWAYGTIYAVWGKVFEPFVRGKPFPVTDLVIASDGAMYVTTGGRKTTSGLYRFTWSREIPVKAALEERPRGRTQIDVSALLDPASAPPTREQLESLRPLLQSSDGVLVHEARTIAQRARPEVLLAFLEDEHDARRIAPLVVAALHAAPDQGHETIVRKLEEIPLRNFGDGFRVDALRAYELALMRCEIDEATRARWRERFAELYPYGMERTDRELALLLAYLDEPRMIDPCLAILECEATQEQKIWVAYCLRALKSGWTIEQRERFFVALDRLRKEAKGGFSLVKYVEEIRKQSIADLPDDVRVALGPLVEDAKVAASSGSAVSASFVHAWTKEELAPKLASAVNARSFERGKLAFTKARCAECHRIAGEGGATGPDLTGAGSRFSRSDLLEAILEPSKAISDQYQDTEILTRDGDLYVGRVESERDGVVALRRLPPQDDVREIALADIERRRLHPMSRMPAGLLDVLDDQEIADLFAYILSGANPADAAFQSPR